MRTTTGHRLLQALRARAEAQLQPPQPISEASEAALEKTFQVQSLLRELETHQLELEMQNAELLAAHQTAERALMGTEQARND